MADQEINIRIALIDEMSAQMKKMRAETDKFFKAQQAEGKKSTSVAGEFKSQVLGMVGPVAIATAGIAALGYAFKSIAKEGMDAEKNAVMLNNTLRNVPLSANTTSDALKKMNDEIVNTSIYTDDAVTESQILMLRFSEIGDKVFPRAMNAAKDLASALQIDLKEAAQMVAVAMADPEMGVRALRAAGVKLDEQQKEQIKTLKEQNDLYGAQKIVLDELTRATEGSAAALADTYAGGWEKVKRSVDEAWESVWDFIVLSNEQQLMKEGGIEAVKSRVDKLKKYQTDVLLGNAFVTKSSADSIQAEIDNLNKLIDADTKLNATRATITKERGTVGTKTPKAGKEGTTTADSGYGSSFAWQVEAAAKQKQEILDAAAKDTLSTLEEYDRVDKLMADRNKERRQEEKRLSKEAAEDARKEAEIKIQAGKQSLNDSVDNLAYLATQMKEFKGVFKAAAITQTAINTAVSAQGIFSNIASTAFLGPAALPLAIAGATAATIAGAARVKEIASYEDGGIVGGTSYSGDRVPARVNSKEMILTQEQQARLFAMSNGKEQGGGMTININVPTTSSVDTRQVVQTVERLARDGYLSNFKRNLNRYN